MAADTAADPGHEAQGDRLIGVLVAHRIQRPSPPLSESAPPLPKSLS